MAGRRLDVLTLTATEKSELTAMASRPKTAQALAQRARIVLTCADGLENKAVARLLDVHAMTVGKWRRRFLAQRVAGLRDDPRPGAPRTIEDERIESVIARTLESQPDGATHWSSRGMALDSGLSVSTVQRIWRAFGLKPHRQETFKLSTDADFVAKVRDVVGFVHLSPPEHALVLCVDEKSQIQALDRSQTVFPMRPGQPERRGHDLRPGAWSQHPCSPRSTLPRETSSASAIRIIALPNSASSSGDVGRSTQTARSLGCRSLCRRSNTGGPATTTAAISLTITE